ncbi:hypothetical protein K502DRAFT_296380, partial [Neoconidiobolus thromboides FSU 785]
TNEQVKEMNYLLFIIKETVRLYPLVYRLSAIINKKSLELMASIFLKVMQINSYQKDFSMKLIIRITRKILFISVMKMIIF